jgi:hypothetical protein
MLFSRDQFQSSLLPAVTRCLGRFTKSAAPWRMVSSPCSAPRHHNPDAELPGTRAARARGTGALMQTTGELLRLLSYVDDIAATLHRIDATIPTLTPEERKRLAEYMRKSDPNFIVVLETLEKEGH